MQPLTKVMVGVGGLAALATVAGVAEHKAATKAAAGGAASSGGAAAKGGGAKVGGVQGTHGSTEGLAGGGGGGPATGGTGAKPNPPSGFTDPNATPSSPNIVDVYPSGPEMFVPQVGPAGSTVNIHAPQMGNVTRVMIDGFQMKLPPGGLPIFSVRTSRDSGSIQVTYTSPASLGELVTWVNYGKQPTTGVPQTVVLDNSAGVYVVRNAGVPNTLLVVQPPSPTAILEPPYYIDGGGVDFFPGPGASVSIRTAHWSGVILVKWLDNNSKPYGATIQYGP